MHCLWRLGAGVLIGRGGYWLWVASCRVGTGLFLSSSPVTASVEPSFPPTHPGYVVLLGNSGKTDDRAQGSCSLSQIAYSVFGTLLRGGGSSGNTDTFHRLFLIPYSRGVIWGQGGGGKVTATCVWGGGCLVRNIVPLSFYWSCSLLHAVLFSSPRGFSGLPCSPG